MINHTSTKVLRKAYEKSMRWRALAEHIILTLNALRKAIKSPHFTLLLAILSAYFLSNAFCTGTISSHSSLALMCVTAVLSSHFVESDKSCSDECPQLIDFIEDLGGDGPKVAAYLRVSKKKLESFSLEAQRDAINKLKSEFKPSKIYWFIDDGKSSKSPEDFDKLKIRFISKLRETEEIQELWVVRVDRMGRVCRKLLYFYLDFCDGGGIIRDSEKVYDMKDLAGIIQFVLEAHAAEKANKDRAAAAVAGKARAFKQKRWNKPVPLGYQKEGWLEKQTNFAPLFREVYQLFLKWENLESVRKRLGDFRALLTKPLTRSQIRRILCDPVYIGKPEHLGEVVIDPDLAFIDEETFRKSLEVLAKIQERCKPKRMGPLEELAVSKPITFLQVLEMFELHHRGCGGVVWKNGTTHDEGPWQQLFKCKKCKTFWRLPPIKPNQGKHQAGAFDKNSMGGLNFDNQSPLTHKKHNAKKGNDGSSDSIRQRLPKCERNSSSTNGEIIGLDLLGHPINDYPRFVKRKQRSPSRIVRKKSDISAKKEQDFGQFLVQANKADS